MIEVRTLLWIRLVMGFGSPCPSLGIGNGFWFGIVRV